MLAPPLSIRAKPRWRWHKLTSIGQSSCSGPRPRAVGSTIGRKKRYRLPTRESTKPWPKFTRSVLRWGCRSNRVAAKIGEFGFTNPVLIDEEDGIIAGHGRVLAAHLDHNRVTVSPMTDPLPVSAPYDMRCPIARTLDIIG